METRPTAQRLVAELEAALARAEPAMRMQRWDEALKWYETAIGAVMMLEATLGRTLDPFAAASLLLGSAAALLRLGRDDEAEMSLERAMEALGSSSNRQRVSRWQEFTTEARSALQGDRAALTKIKAQADLLRPLTAKEAEAASMVFYVEAVIERRLALPVMKEELEVEAESLEQARERLASRMPQGFQVLSEWILADGKQRTAKAVADTTEAAFAQAESELPADADVLERQVFIAPTRQIITIKAADQQDAESSARFEARAKLGSGARVSSLKLTVPGSRGVLGFGSKLDQYEAEIAQSATVGITYRTKAKISATVGVDLKMLFAGLYSNDGNQRQASSEALAQIGAPIVESLIARIGIGLPEYVTRTVEATLARIGAPAVEPLIHLLQDADQHARRGAAAALGPLGIQLHDIALRTLTVESLIAALTDLDQSVRGLAAEALGVIGDLQTLEPLVIALKDVKPEVRSAAARALEKLGNVQATASLIVALGDKDQFVRACAASALGKIGDAQAVEPLTVVLQDGEISVRQAAARALARLGYELEVQPPTDRDKDRARPVESTTTTAPDRGRYAGEQKEERRIETGVGQQQAEVPGELAILPLRGMVVYPLTFQALNVTEPRSLRLVGEAAMNKQMIGLVASRGAEKEEPGSEDVYKVGVLATIQRMFKAPDGTVRLLVQGVERIRIDDWVVSEPYLRANIGTLPDKVEDSSEIQALMHSTVDLLRRLVPLVPQLSDELLMAAMNVNDPRQLVYFIATNIRMEVADAQTILEIDNVSEKLLKLTTLMTNKLDTQSEGQ